MDTHSNRRWYALATVAAAQFLAVADAFIVNVAIPSIRADLHASGAEIQAIIAVYQIAYAALVITGGRLGDIFGRKRIFLTGVIGFTLASLWCGLALGAPMLIFARGVQGAAAAMMVPQVLASIHTLFPDAARARAFAIFGVAIGLGAAVGFIAGGWLVALNLAGMGWRSIFGVNVPIGIAIVIAALLVMPAMPRGANTRLDLPGTTVLLAGLLGLIVPLLLGREFGWSWWVWLMMAAGAITLAAFLRLERATERRGGMPLIDLALLEDRVFTAGMCATFCFFLGNLSFYFVLTMYLQNGLGFSAFNAALTVLPLAFAFVAGSRLGGAVDRGLRGASTRPRRDRIADRQRPASYNADADAAAGGVRIRPGDGAGATVQRGPHQRPPRPCGVRRWHPHHDAADCERHRRCSGRRGVLRRARIT